MQNLDVEEDFRNINNEKSFFQKNKLFIIIGVICGVLVIIGIVLAIVLTIPSESKTTPISTNTTIMMTQSTTTTASTTTTTPLITTTTTSTSTSTSTTITTTTITTSTTTTTTTTTTRTSTTTTTSSTSTTSTTTTTTTTTTTRTTTKPPFDFFEVIQSFEGHTEEINAPIVELSNGHLASMSSKAIKIWNRKTGECENTIYIGDRIYFPYELVALPDGNLAAATYDVPSEIEIFSSITGDVIKTLIGHLGYIGCILFISLFNKLIIICDPNLNLSTLFGFKLSKQNLAD